MLNFIFLDNFNINFYLTLTLMIYLWIMDISLSLILQEEALIKACINNERWAQKKLFEDNYKTLMSLALRYGSCEDDALDIMHESFIKVFKNLDKYQCGTSLQSWLKRILVNTAIDFYRKEIKRKSEELTEAHHLTSTIPDALSNLNSEEILKALQLLPPSYRSVFNMHIIEGFSHREISEILGINESTCRSNLVKARTRLKQILLGLE